MSDIYLLGGQFCLQIYTSYDKYSALCAGVCRLQGPIYISYDKYSAVCAGVCRLQGPIYISFDKYSAVCAGVCRLPGPIYISYDKYSAVCAGVCSLQGPIRVFLGRRRRRLAFEGRETCQWRGMIFHGFCSYFKKHLLQNYHKLCFISNCCIFPNLHSWCRLDADIWADIQKADIEYFPIMPSSTCLLLQALKKQHHDC